MKCNAMHTPLFLKLHEAEGTFFLSPFLVHGEQKWSDLASAIKSSFSSPFYRFLSPDTAKILNKRRMKGLV